MTASTAAAVPTTATTVSSTTWTSLGVTSEELHGPAYEWALWSTTIRLITSDPHALSSARRLVDGELAHVELATSRFRRDSEVSTLPAGRRVRISSTLTQILSAALWAAPWESIELDEQAQTVLLPRGVQLDLGAISRAWAADRCASVVADDLGVGVLVSLGGNIATAGPVGSAGGGAWEIVVQDQPDDPAPVIAVPTGLAVATASSATLGWRPGGRETHHLLSPRTGMPVSSLWRSATVVAPDCVTASTWAAGALVESSGSAERLESQGYPARMVGADGSVRLLSGWPADAEEPAAAG